MVLKLEQRPDHIIGEAAMAVRGPGSDHAMPRIGAERLHEGQVVRGAHLLEIVEDRELGRRILVKTPPDMLEIVVEQIVVGALQETLGIERQFFVPKAAYLDALAADPGKTKRIIKRMQHRKGEMDAHQRQAGGSEPLAKAFDDRFQRRVAERRPHQPVGNLVDEDFGYVVVRRGHFASSP
ncbi:hypothetical protein D9M70_503160 [compost metagenome]